MACSDIPPADPLDTRSDGGATNGVAPPPAGFELLDEIGRGGMGVVYRARDLALDRDVAVKLLHVGLATTSGTARRFVDEARITAQLQHPGIPAVYQVGTWGDGRPFLAMKLVKGHTLDELLKADAPLDRLAVFEGVCHAVGYAHAHGVMHRDLKPANVMVGSYGEVQVMDWGLAKVLTDDQPEGTSADPEATVAATEIRPGREAETPFTQFGSVLGTPSFMAPEQAAGETGKIDRRADVFGLGAVLCVLLTGKPPFTGKDADSVRLSAVRGKTDEAFARLDGCGADPGVVALCKRCLSFEPADRPASAGEVAECVADLRRASDERAKRAEQEKVSAELREVEQRKRRRTVQWAAGVVGTVLLAGVVGTTVGFVRADRAREIAEAAALKASREEDRAKKNQRTAQDAVRETFHKLASSTLAEVPGSGQLRYELSDLARRYTEKFVREDPNNLDVLWDALDVYRMLGRMYWYANQPEKAWTHFERALEYGRRLVGMGQAAVGDGELPLTADGRLTIRVRLTADGTPVDETPQAAQRAHEFIDMHVRTLGQAAGFLRDYGRAADARRLLDEADGPDLRGKLLTRCPDVRAFRRVKAQADLVRADLDADEGRAAAALERYDRLVELFRGLHEAPKPPNHLARIDEWSRPETDARNLGRVARGRAVALLTLGRPAEAENALDDAIGRLEKSTKSDDWTRLGTVLDGRARVRGVDPARRSDALADLDRALTILQKQHQDYDYFAPVTRSLAEALVARGRLLAAGDAADRRKAKADFEAARTLCEKLAAITEGPLPPVDQTNWGDAEAGLGLLAEADDRSGAEKWWTSAAARYAVALKTWPTFAQAVRGREDAQAALKRLAPDRPAADPKPEK